MPLIDITVQNVKNLLINLNPHKSSGPNNLCPKVLKHLSKGRAPVFSYIIQESLRTGTVPTDWKGAHAGSIHKWRPKEDVRNYRPMSLTCI